jgi:hypothetical protein
MDLQDLLARKLGNAIHDSIEGSWLRGHARALKLLGYDEETVSRVMINPTDEALAKVRASGEVPIPVYLEQRAIKQFEGWNIGGKFDMCADGIVQDHKSTGVYTWIKGGRDEDHILQGSLYKWLHPDKITADYMEINYIFTDWSKAMANSTPNYPDTRLKTKRLPLMSTDEVEHWVSTRLALFLRYRDLPEEQIPDCTPEELWQSESKFKYYSDAAKAKLPGARSTKNFDSKSEAHAFMASKGGVGVVKEVPGEPKRCGYCDGAPGCKQRERLFQ